MCYFVLVPINHYLCVLQQLSTDSGAISQQNLDSEWQNFESMLGEEVFMPSTELPSNPQAIDLTEEPKTSPNQRFVY